MVHRKKKGGDREVNSHATVSTKLRHREKPTHRERNPHTERETHTHREKPTHRECRQRSGW